MLISLYLLKIFLFQLVTAWSYWPWKLVSHINNWYHVCALEVNFRSLTVLFGSQSTCYMIDGDTQYILWRWETLDDCVLQGMKGTLIWLRLCVHRLSPAVTAAHDVTTRGSEGHQREEVSVHISLNPPFFFSIIFPLGTQMFHCSQNQVNGFETHKQKVSRAVNCAEAAEHKESWLTAHKQLALTFQRSRLMTGLN